MAENGLDAPSNIPVAIPETHPPVHALSSFLIKFRSELSTKIIVAASVFTLSYATIIWSGLLSYINDYINGKVISIVSHDISDTEKSMIFPIILQKFSSAGSSEFTSRIKTMIDVALRQDVGALTTGQFELDQTSPSNTVQIFSPPGHDAKLFIQAMGLGREQRIIVLTSGGQRRSLLNSGVFEINLSDLLRSPPDLQSRLIQGASQSGDDDPPPATQQQSYFQHIHSLTFQLGNATQRKSLQLNSIERVSVRYICFTTPLIELESK